MHRTVLLLVIIFGKYIMSSVSILSTKLFNLVSIIIIIGICCIVLLAIMIGGMLTGSVLGIRYGRIEKERKIVMP